MGLTLNSCLQTMLLTAELDAALSSQRCVLRYYRGAACCAIFAELRAAPLSWSCVQQYYRGTSCCTIITDLRAVLTGSQNLIFRRVRLSPKARGPLFVKNKGGVLPSLEWNDLWAWNLRSRRIVATEKCPQPMSKEILRRFIWYENRQPDLRK